MPGDDYALSGNPNVHSLKLAPVSLALIMGDQTIIAGVPGKRLKVYVLVLNVALAVTLTLKSGTTPVSGAMALPANANIALAVNPPTFVVATNAGDALILNLGTAVATSGWLAYWDDDTV